MLFSEAIFLFCFLPIVLLVYFVSPWKFRNTILLAASLLFYWWGEGGLIWIMAGSIAVNYLCGLWIGRSVGIENRSRVPLFVAVAANLWILGIYKYGGFIVHNLNSLLGLFGLPSVRMEDVRLPIGISFYTFHALSYIMDIWRGKAVVERNPFRFALYISMFPQLVAGPIIRYSHIARQLVSRTVRTDSFVYGIRRFVIGLGKKLIIADKLAVRADCVFGLQGDYLTTPAAWFGIVCYTLQIYFDFSGYSDMAIGLGRMFGFRFRENFRYPYISQSITEFWRRWHISLSSWFRDYLYIPLGGNRHGAWRTHANLLIVFLLCGLWHGASWNFVVWGIYHGFFLVGERWLGSRTNRRIPGAARTAYAVLVVTVGWVFFRADSISHALDYLAALSRIRGGQGSPFVPGLLLDRGIILVLVAAIIGATPFLRRVASLVRKCRTKLKGHQRIVFEGVSGILGFLFVGAILVYSVMSMAAGTYSPFIYFRF